MFNHSVGAAFINSFFIKLCCNPKYSRELCEFLTKTYFILNEIDVCRLLDLLLFLTRSFDLGLRMIKYQHVIILTIGDRLKERTQTLQTRPSPQQNGHGEDGNV